MIGELGKWAELFPEGVERLREGRDRRAQFTPVMRFILADAERRTFYAQRWCYLGSVDDWIVVGPGGRVEKLARELVPNLGTDRYFELF